MKPYIGSSGDPDKGPLNFWIVDTYVWLSFSGTHLLSIERITPLSKCLIQYGLSGGPGG